MRDMLEDRRVLDTESFVGAIRPAHDDGTVGHCQQNGAMLSDEEPVMESVEILGGDRRHDGAGNVAPRIVQAPRHDHLPLCAAIHAYSDTYLAVPGFSVAEDARSRMKGGRFDGLSILVVDGEIEQGRIRFSYHRFQVSMQSRSGGARDAVRRNTLGDAVERPGHCIQRQIRVFDGGLRDVLAGNPALVELIAISRVAAPEFNRGSAQYDRQDAPADCADEELRTAVDRRYGWREPWLRGVMDGSGHG
ncbi:conserved hypothetical protein [Ricinus communis]|uniref:Uncharacterized protein n=1 Tax=Ricinus communis TaxID=3988 RepID=B9TH40_RICCO|nr:conserved hypothetical protein [Ricinus communis]